MFAWLAGHGVVFLLLEIFQCVPIEAVWDLAVPGKCHNELNVFYLGAAASIFEDLYILVLPIPCISSLQMGTGKKVILCFVFAIGSLYVFLSNLNLIGGLTCDQRECYEHNSTEISILIRHHYRFDM